MDAPSDPCFKNSIIEKYKLKGNVYSDFMRHDFGNASIKQIFDNVSYAIGHDFYISMKICKLFFPFTHLVKIFTYDKYILNQMKLNT